MSYKRRRSAGSGLAVPPPAQYPPFTPSTFSNPFDPSEALPQPSFAPPSSLLAPSAPMTSYPSQSQPPGTSRLAPPRKKSRLSSDRLEESKGKVTYVMPQYAFKNPRWQQKKATVNAPTRQQNLKTMLMQEDHRQIPNYMSLEAGPSRFPAKKYCDITGFEAKYKDPQTTLRYSRSEHYAVIRALPVDTVTAYLTVRGAQNNNRLM
eukprot:g30562.t1